MFFQSPEEIEAQHQRYHMEQEAQIHGVIDLIHSLDEEQLKNFIVLMSGLTDAQNSALIAGIHLGQARAIGSNKFGWCKCGREHETPEQMLAKEVDRGAERVAAEHPVAGRKPEPLELDELPNMSAVEEAAAANRLILAEEYNVAFAADPTDPSVICKGCGQTYPSLRDRMVKGPDACHFCHLKSSGG